MNMMNIEHNESHSNNDMDLLYLNTELLHHQILINIHISCQALNTYIFSVSFINHQAFRGSTGSTGAGGAVWLAPSMTKQKENYFSAEK